MASTQITQRCTYRYDPKDRLINQIQPDTPTLQRFYCKSRLATEIQGATKHSIIQHDDLLLAQQQREGDTLDTTLLITDLQRSVLHTLKKATQPQPIAYSPYGHRPAFNGLLSLLGFNGERADPVTGHYLLGNGYRAFNPVLMRFNDPDRLSPFGKGGLNTYAYCLGDPINRYDPNGGFSISTFVSSVITTFRRWVHPSPPTYKSGAERTYEKSTPGEFKTVKIVIAEEKSISKFEHDVWNITKRNPTLQELIYSKLTPDQMQQLPRKLPYRIDSEVDLFNMLNTSETMIPILMQRNKILRGDAFVLASKLAAADAIQGKLTGVHPLKANQLIRERRYLIY